MRRTKEDAAATREDILDAAERVFFEKGVARATLEQIAMEAGVTRGAVYWHFNNKVEVFDAMRKRVVLPQDEIVARALADGAMDPLTAIESVTLDSLRRIAGCEQRKRIYSIILSKCEYTDEFADVVRQQRESGQRLRRQFKKAFERAEAMGIIDPAWQPEIAARALHCMLTGLMSEWLRLGQSLDLVRVGTPMVSKFLQSLRRSPA